jgi:hypothetical protein
MAHSRINFFGVFLFLSGIYMMAILLASRIYVVISTPEKSWYKSGIALIFADFPLIYARSHSARTRMNQIIDQESVLRIIRSLFGWFLKFVFNFFTDTRVEVSKVLTLWPFQLPKTLTCSNRKETLALTVEFINLMLFGSLMWLLTRMLIFSSPFFLFWCVEA